MQKNTKRIVAVGAPLAIVAGVGIAFAAWTANGSGDGGASAATAQTITLTAATGAGDLFPGGYGQVNFTESNTNPYAVTFDTVSSVVKGAVVAPNSSATKPCAASDF